MNRQMIPRMKEQEGMLLIPALIVMVARSVRGLAFSTTGQADDTIAADYRNQTAGDLAGIVPPALSDLDYICDTSQVRGVRTTPYAARIDSGRYVGLDALLTLLQVTAGVTGPHDSHARLSVR